VTDSPCIRRCTLDEDTAWCLGCVRTLDEIATWSGLDDEGKRAILALIAVRREALAKEPSAMARFSAPFKVESPGV
jgi:uncharacterized protein